MDRRTFLVGLGSLAGGSGAILEAGAVTTVDADRSADVQTAADPSALLGLDGVDDAGTTPTFTNNSDGTMVVKLSASGARFDVGDTGSFETQPVTFELGPGVTRQVVIDGDSGPVPVSVDARIEDDDGTVVGSISLERDYAVGTAERVESGTTREGDINTESDVIVEQKGSVEGDIDSGGSVSVGQKGTVEGDIDSDGSVSVGQKGTVEGDVTAEGDLTIGRKATIEGDVSANNVTVGPKSTIQGDIIADGDVTLEDGATVEGDVDASGTVYIGCDVDVEGDIIASSTEETCQ